RSGGGAGFVAALAVAGETDAARAVDDQRTGQFGEARLLAKVDESAAVFAEMPTDVLAIRFALAHGVAHVANHQPSWRGADDVIRKHRVWRVCSARDYGDRQL